MDENVPLPTLDCKLETDIQIDDCLIVFPIRQDIDASNKPYDFPIKVTETDPEVGTLARILEDIKGASKVKAEENEDDKIAVVTATNIEGLWPRGLLHETLESDIQPKELHDVRERRALVEVANMPKFEPEIVTQTDDVTGRFVISTELINGAAYVNAFKSDPI